MTDSNLIPCLTETTRYGAYQITKGLDKNNLKLSFVMEAIGDSLRYLNDNIQIINNRISFYQKKDLEVQKDSSFFAKLGGILGMLVLASIIYYTPLKEGELPTTITQKIYKGMEGLAGNSQQLILSANIMVAIASSIYHLKEAKYESSASGLQGVYLQLRAEMDNFSKSMELSSKTINENMKSIKYMLENDYSSKSKDVYLG